MKTMAAMKTMKAMKKKAVTKIAKGRMAKVVVFRGSKAKTSGGLTTNALMKNKSGRIQQETACEREGPLCKVWQELDLGSPEGKEGTWCEGLRCYQEGHSSLHEGQGVLQLSVSAGLEL